MKNNLCLPHNLLMDFIGRLNAEIVVDTDNTIMFKILTEGANEGRLFIWNYSKQLGEFCQSISQYNLT